MKPRGQPDLFGGGVITDLRELTEAEKGYAAGLFDGEGCVRVKRFLCRKRGKSYTQHQLIATLGMCDPAPVDWLATTFGGSVHIEDRSGKNHRTMYRWEVGDLIAKPFLELILPHSLTKAPQIRLALRFLAERGNAKGKRIEAKEMEKREWFRQEMRRLKTAYAVYNPLGARAGYATPYN